MTILGYEWTSWVHGHRHVLYFGDEGEVLTQSLAIVEWLEEVHPQPPLLPAEPAFCGSQFRMSELTGAVALAQLRKVDRIRAHCRKLSGRA